MREFTITAADQDKRLDRFASKMIAGISAGMAQKYIRLKKIKVNKKPGKPDQRLCAGDVVDVWLPDDAFEAEEKPDRLYENFKPHVKVVFEGDDVIIVDKRPGLICHPDENEKVDTLLTHVRAYLYQKGAWSGKKSDFAPTVLNRLDRFTGGLVVIAKTERALKAVNDAMRNQDASKGYVCICHGQPKPSEGEFRSYLVQTGNRVSVSKTPTPGGKLSITLYKTIASKGGLSLVQLELLTGRTHQIRAQMADAGCPILGDSQYGRKDDDKRFGRGYQALCAVRLAFADGVLEELDGKVFTADAPFVREYFPQTRY